MLHATYVDHNFNLGVQCTYIVNNLNCVFDALHTYYYMNRIRRQLPIHVYLVLYHSDQDGEREIVMQVLQTRITNYVCA